MHACQTQSIRRWISSYSAEVDETGRRMRPSVQEGTYGGKNCPEIEQNAWLHAMQLLQVRCTFNIKRMHAFYVSTRPRSVWRTVRVGDD
jgi:hypothetical protein